MNSINIISSRVSPTSSPVPSRSNSLSAISLAIPTEETIQEDPTEADPLIPKPNANADPPSSRTPAAPVDLEPKPETPAANPTQLQPLADDAEAVSPHPDPVGEPVMATEDTPLLPSIDEKTHDVHMSSWHPRRLATTFITSIRWMLSTLAAPGVYIWACLCNDDGTFAPWMQLRKLLGLVGGGNVPKLKVESCDTSTDESRTASRASLGTSGSRRRSSTTATTSALVSESDVDRPAGPRRDSSSRASARRHSKSKSMHGTESVGSSQRSIKIKVHEGDSLRQRKHRKAASTAASASSRSSKSGSDGLSPGDISAQLKSPTSPISALTKYPKTPAPPRPLLPRRQPSYINYEPSTREGQKTLILDLDETLIHSMSKGGRMGTGHMVEVRLSTTYVGAGGQTTVSPQHPILYYVHKRPHCDEFLRRVHKWYNLVVFTASVQEYADPVIDWLESERKFFTKRYYRQHCTFRHGAFIKDLSSVEPDLSKVMILDNSPLSYMFHQDNAIPIQGWINDPTDNDLLHLVPLLEGLQYVSDVRALLALRGGEDGQHMNL